MGLINSPVCVWSPLSETALPLPPPHPTPPPRFILFARSSGSRNCGKSPLPRAFPPSILVQSTDIIPISPLLCFLFHFPFSLCTSLVTLQRRAVVLFRARGTREAAASQGSACPSRVFLCTTTPSFPGGPALDGSARQPRGCNWCSYAPGPCRDGGSDRLRPRAVVRCGCNSYPKDCSALSGFLPRHDLCEWIDISTSINYVMLIIEIPYVVIDTHFVPCCVVYRI